jgi:DNA replication and repair protein RecF
MLESVPSESPGPVPDPPASDASADTHDVDQHTRGPADALEARAANEKHAGPHDGLRDGASVLMAAHALRIANLTLEGFRNLAPLSFEPGPRFNVLFGDNGAGKSSVLEAIGYVAALRSFRQARKDDMIATDAGRTVIRMGIHALPLSRDYRIVLDRQAGRSVQVDGKKPRSLGSYYGLLPSVLFHPGDTELMSGSPEARRAFLDRILEQIDPGYARLVDDYTKALRSRNRLLKTPRVEPRSVIAYDGLLADLGARIGSARMSLTRELKPLVEAHFAEITEQALPLDVSYAARHQPDRELLLRTLAESLDKDLVRGYTGTGPHGDDLRAGIKQTLAKHHASQGQHRALVLALKVAELSVLAQHTQQLPLLLLDDVSSELDRSRNRRFFQLLAKLGGQVFLTTTHREFILLDEARTDFQLDAGRLTRV